MALPASGEISIGMLHYEVVFGDSSTTSTGQTAVSSDAGATLSAIANDFSDNATSVGGTSRADLAAAPYGMDEFYQYSYNSCVLVGTEILMFDNSIKLGEDLIIDDEVSSVQIPGMTKQNYRKFSTGNLDLFRGEPGRVKLLAFDFVTKHIRINDKYNATHMHPMFVWKDSISRFEW